ncbi:MAG: hypothetical protein AABW92_00230 [Nanoarchaeota archaeon]
MKKTGEMLFTLVLQLVLALLLVFKISSVNFAFWLLLLNVVLFVFLALEPYWKIGAWLTYLISVEVSFYVLNLMFFNTYLTYSGYLTLIALLFGIALVYVAHRLRIKEKEYIPDDGGEEFNFEDSGEPLPLHKPEPESEDELDEESEEEQEEPETENNNETKAEIKSYVATKDDVVHLESCGDLEDEKETRIIGSKRYASSSKFKACEKCKPFE